SRGAWSGCASRGSGTTPGTASGTCRRTSRTRSSARTCAKGCSRTCAGWCSDARPPRAAARVRSFLGFAAEARRRAGAAAAHARGHSLRHPHREQRAAAQRSARAPVPAELPPRGRWRTFPLRERDRAESAGRRGRDLRSGAPALAARLSLPRVPRRPFRRRSADAAAGCAGAGLARFDDRVTYVLGAGGRDTAAPQLWLYKDSYAPARLIAQGGADLRLLEYGNPAAADWFPRAIELWNAGQLAARFEVLESKGVRGTPAQEEEDDSDE